MVKRGLGIIFLFVFGILLIISISNFASAAACASGTYDCTCKCGANDGDACAFNSECGTGSCTNEYWTLCTICGDDICNGAETCSTCSADCGNCSTPPQVILCLDDSECPSGQGCVGAAVSLCDSYTIPLEACFISDTLVTMVNGDLKNIQDVKVGDILKGEKTNNKVLGLHRPELNGKLYSFNGGRYFVTEEHPFKTTEGWKSINPKKTLQENIGITVTELKIGDTLITETGKVLLKTINSKDAKANTDLFNFILDGDHTYYADGYIVHNKMACDGTYPCLGSDVCVDAQGYPTEVGACAPCPGTCYSADYTASCGGTSTICSISSCVGCHGTVIGSTPQTYEGESCSQFTTPSECDQGWLTHGCYWNSNLFSFETFGTCEDEYVCTPESDTAFCLGLNKECGSVTGIDNCENSRTVNCGTCLSSETCTAGQCSCTAESNAVFCSRLDKNCGSVTADDNCGTSRTVNCGSCTAPNTCNPLTGRCGSCVDTCSSLGYNCGTQTICAVGTNCGTCSGGQTCNSTGQCATVCTDTCSSLGYNCGIHTICEASENCGSCSAGDSCDSRGICVTDCTDTCSALGYNCGTQTICGEPANCGTCSAGNSCNSLGVCTPNCVDTCSSLGYTCGAHTICGVPNVNCGTCSAGLTCDSLGACVVDCVDTCSSLGYNCGTQTVCEVDTNCGSCSAGSECYLGTCIPSCVLSSPVWNITNAVRGQKVEARVQGTNCNGQVVSFEVREDDGFFGTDAVQTNPSNSTMSAGLAIGTWTAEWPGYGDNETTPEYYFIANINLLEKTITSSKSSTDELKVIERIDAECAGINYCSNYDTLTSCTADACDVAEDSVESVNPSITCGLGYACGCAWDISESPKCNPIWNGTNDCGNKIKDFGEQCDDGNLINGDGCSNTCQYECGLHSPCSVGTTLCSDGTCSLNCGYCDNSTTCNYNSTCDAGEGCTCSDCDVKQDTCEEGLLCSLDDEACCKSEADGTCDNYCSFVDPDCTGEVCGNGIEETGEQCDDGNTEFGDGCSATCQYECGLDTPCPVGTTLCSDGTCSLNCGKCDEGTKCDYDTICETGEGCTCRDCNGKLDTCTTGLLCSLTDHGCCNSISDGVCNRYCAFVDPDCKPSPLGIIGNCTYTENGQDTCEDDNMLTRSINALWAWAEWNKVSQIDPLNKHSKCANVNDVIPCPPSVQVSFFGIYSFVGVIVLVVLIYLLYSLKKKNNRKKNSKSNSKKRKGKKK